MLWFQKTAEEREKTCDSHHEESCTNTLLKSRYWYGSTKEYKGFTQPLRAMANTVVDGLLKKIDNALFIGTLYILREVLLQLSTATPSKQAT